MASSSRAPVVEFEEEDVGDAVSNTSLTLVGRFLTNRPVRTHIMKERMAGVWRPGKGVNIREAGQGTFLFQFFHPLDVQKVLKQGPWSFDKHLLILSTIPEGMVPSEVPLFQIPFWVQVHNVPTGFMSEAIGKHVGNAVGSFLEYDAKNSSEFWRLYMRIRVLLDVRQPLLKSLKLKKKGGEAKEVTLKYERLDIFCYLCGMLGHAEGECGKLFEMQFDDGSRGWGPELKAEGRRGGDAGGARWLREENQPWVAPSVINASATRGGPLQNDGDRNQSSSLRQPATASNNDVTQGVAQLVEVFKNPSLLFAKLPTKLNEDPPATNSHPVNNEDVHMTAAVEVEENRLKRMREGVGGRSETEADCSDDWGESGAATVVIHPEGAMLFRDDSFLWAGPGRGACQEQ